MFPKLSPRTSVFRISWARYMVQISVSEAPQLPGCSLLSSTEKLSWMYSLSFWTAERQRRCSAPSSPSRRLFCSHWHRRGRKTPALSCVMGIAVPVHHLMAALSPAGSPDLGSAAHRGPLQPLKPCWSGAADTKQAPSNLTEMFFVLQTVKSTVKAGCLMWTSRSWPDGKVSGLNSGERLWLSRYTCCQRPHSAGNDGSFPPRSPRRLVLQGGNSMVRSAKNTAGVQQPQPSTPPGQEPKAELARPEPLSFCCLPLEGTSCSSQQGNKRSRLAPDLPGEKGNWWAVGMLLPQLQTCHQSKGDAPAKFGPAESTPRTTHRAHQQLKLADAAAKGSSALLHASVFRLG